MEQTTETTTTTTTTENVETPQQSADMQNSEGVTPADNPQMEQGGEVETETQEVEQPLINFLWFDNWEKLYN